MERQLEKTYTLQQYHTLGRGIANPKSLDKDQVDTWGAIVNRQFYTCG